MQFIQSNIKLKIIGIGLFFFILNSNFIGLYLFQIQKTYHQKTQLKKISTHKCSNRINKLTFTLSDLHQTVQWKKRTEFKFNNKMYDIVHSETDCDLINFWCIPDEKEDNINHSINQWVNFCWRPNESLPSSPILKMYKFTYDGILIPKKRVSVLAFINNKNFHYQFPFSEIEQTIIIPPPKISC